jgi:hypothetical protein
MHCNMTKNPVSDCHCQPPAPCPESTATSERVTAERTSRFRLQGMDCPSEEQLVRMQLAGRDDVAGLEFDLPQRILTVHHIGTPEVIAKAVAPLGFGHALIDTGPCLAVPTPDGDERRVLWQLMLINALMFLVEIVTGWWAESTGLIADGFDMLADAAVYALALAAVGGAAHHKLRTAHLSGGLQLVLGLGILFEVGRRVWFGAEPQPPMMLMIATLALCANLACVMLLARHRDAGAHMKASWIFTANDALANLGVIVAGLLVGWLQAPWPDWLIGTAIGALILNGAWRILRLRA